MEFRGKKIYFTKQNLPWYLYRGGGGGGAVYKRSKIHPQTWKCFTKQQQNNLTKWCVARKGIPSCVLFRGMVRNGIPRFCIYFGSMERNSELYSLPQKVSEQNNGILLLFLFYGTEFRVVFSSAEGFGTEFRDFLFRGTTGIPPEITICSVYSVFRGIIFLSEIPNPRSISLHW
jgi:hypothetical protein